MSYATAAAAAGPTSPNGTDMDVDQSATCKWDRPADTIEGETDDLQTGTRIRKKAKKPKLDAVMDKLSDMSTTLSRQNVLLAHLPIIRAKMDTISDEVAPLKTTTGQLSDTTGILLTQTNDLATENAALKCTVSALEARVDQLVVAGNANALSHQRVQPSMNNELTVSGLAFGQIDSTNLLGTL